MFFRRKVTRTKWTKANRPLGVAIWSPPRGSPTWQRLSGFDFLHHLLLLHRLVLGALGHSVGDGLPLQLPQAHHLHEGQAPADGVAVALRAVQLAVGEGFLAGAQGVAVFSCKSGKDGSKSGSDLYSSRFCFCLEPQLNHPTQTTASLAVVR